MSELREKCAVAGVSLAESGENAAAMVYDQLFAMQHRGAEASGIVSLTNSGRIDAERHPGLVPDVYSPESLFRMAGNLAVGHNRYSTSGSKEEHLQPIKYRELGLALGHNGNLPDIDDLSANLERHGLVTRFANDSEMMAMTIAQALRSKPDLPRAIENVYHQFKGAYSCVAMHHDQLVAFRDPHGIRPLVIGQFDNDYFVASETCGLDIVDARHHVRDIAPGEMVIIQDGKLESRQLAEGDLKFDMFELVYFARHDSRMFGKSVYKFRRDFGTQLAKEHPPTVEDHDNVVVVPVPDTSLPIATGYAEALGLHMEQAIVKNRYIGRTFMQPTQNDRHQQLRRKHNLAPEPIVGKDVVLVDDSIVRLNTMPRLVQLLREEGARTVSVVVGSPPVRFPDFYGIDTPSQTELAAANITTEEMRRKIESHSLGFLSLSGMIDATGLPADMFNLSCFNGEYPVSIGKRAKDIYAPVSMQYAD